MWLHRNLNNFAAPRLRQGGINVPEPIILRGHVLVMEFIGEDGWPSPKLKDVALSENEAAELYADFLVMMRLMYQDCKLVHADLSEFNILYHKGRFLYYEGEFLGGKTAVSAAVMVPNRMRLTIARMHYQSSRVIVIVVYHNESCRVRDDC